MKNILDYYKSYFSSICSNFFIIESQEIQKLDFWSLFKDDLIHQEDKMKKIFSSEDLNNLYQLIDYQPNIISLSEQQKAIKNLENQKPNFKNKHHIPDFSTIELLKNSSLLAFYKKNDITFSTISLDTIKQLDELQYPYSVLFVLNKEESVKDIYHFLKNYDNYDWRVFNVKDFKNYKEDFSYIFNDMLQNNIFCNYYLSELKHLSFDELMLWKNENPDNFKIIISKYHQYINLDDDKTVHFILENFDFSTHHMNYFPKINAGKYRHLLCYFLKKNTHLIESPLPFGLSETLSPIELLKEFSQVSFNLFEKKFFEENREIIEEELKNSTKEKLTFNFNFENLIQSEEHMNHFFMIDSLFEHFLKEQSYIDHIQFNQTSLNHYKNFLDNKKNELFLIEDSNLINRMGKILQHHIVGEDVWSFSQINDKMMKVNLSLDFDKLTSVAFVIKYYFSNHEYKNDFMTHCLQKNIDTSLSDDVFILIAQNKEIFKNYFKDKIQESSLKYSEKEIWLEGHENFLSLTELSIHALLSEDYLNKKQIPQIELIDHFYQYKKNKMNLVLETLNEINQLSDLNSVDEKNLRKQMQSFKQMMSKDLDSLMEVDLKNIHFLSIFSRIKNEQLTPDKDLIQLLSKYVFRDSPLSQTEFIRFQIAGIPFVDESISSISRCFLPINLTNKNIELIQKNDWENVLEDMDIDFLQSSDFIENMKINPQYTSLYHHIMTNTADFSQMTSIKFKQIANILRTIDDDLFEFKQPFIKSFFENHLSYFEDYLKNNNLDYEYDIQDCLINIQKSHAVVNYLNNTFDFHLEDYQSKIMQSILSFYSTKEINQKLEILNPQNQYKIINNLLTNNFGKLIDLIDNSDNRNLFCDFFNQLSEADTLAIFERNHKNLLLSFIQSCQSQNDHKKIILNIHSKDGTEKLLTHFESIDFKCYSDQIQEKEIISHLMILPDDSRNYLKDKLIENYTSDVCFSSHMKPTMTFRMYSYPYFFKENFSLDEQFKLISHAIDNHLFSPKDQNVKAFSPLNLSFVQKRDDLNALDDWPDLHYFTFMTNIFNSLAFNIFKKTSPFEFQNKDDFEKKYNIPFDISQSRYYHENLFLDDVLNKEKFINGFDLFLQKNYKGSLAKNLIERGIFMSRLDFVSIGQEDFIIPMFDETLEKKLFNSFIENNPYSFLKQNNINCKTYEEILIYLKKHALEFNILKSLNSMKNNFLHDDNQKRIQDYFDIFIHAYHDNPLTLKKIKSFLNHDDIYLKNEDKAELNQKIEILIENYLIIQEVKPSKQHAPQKRKL